MQTTAQGPINWSLTYYSGDRKTGSVVVIKNENGKTTLNKIPTAAESGLEALYKPVFLGMTDDERVLLMDPASKALSMQDSFPADAFTAHAYPDLYSERVYLMNDGDKATGNDTLNCGDQGSSVTIVEMPAKPAAGAPPATVVATVCVGRGHHVAAFSAPSDEHPDTPRRAFISNLKDGTVSIIGNDPEDSATYMKVVHTVNLFDAEKEAGDEATIPNDAFPHGMDYCPRTGKLYCLNNGYASVAVIDPASGRIDNRITMALSKNLLIHPHGRFIMGKGADRKSDPAHVIGELIVLDAQQAAVTSSIKMPDVYGSKYSYSLDGSKMYVTAAATGSDEQKANLKTDVLMVYDVSSLPEITLKKELKVGRSDGGSRSIAFEGDYIFLTNPSQGSITIIDGRDDSVVDTIDVGEGVAHARIYGMKT